MRQYHKSWNLSPRESRSGFSLIELMAVIVVISILLAMLLPAINSARRTARNAQVVSDIKNIEAGIANFKSKYGIEPPSSFILREDGAYTSDKIDRDSLALMRVLWPDYDPTTGTVVQTTPSISRDLNEDGNQNSVFQMNGAECLVFFLGGPGMLFDKDATDGIKNVVPMGFSANPTNPFASGGTRVGPFYEFNLSRLSDVSTPPNGCPELLDPLPNQTMPYQYFSSYGGRGYALNPNATIANVFDHIKGTSDDMVSVYFQSSRGTSAPFTIGFWNPKSYQIISPGPDGLYGTGGGYRENKFFGNDGTAARQAQAERDNITNFSGGPLQP
ncbi:MAG TPA: type II secretion system protein [Planctomicrobium sp.]|nr:type II secretion system protein [Planctomicrobium sp.]